MEKICKLCQQNEATQTNSHIFPRFFKKDYLKTNKGFFYYDIPKQKVDRKVQDLPKEDYIFCPECERRFQTLEHFASLYLDNSYNRLKKSDFPIAQKHSDCQLAPTCDPKVFTLFIYSLIWRAHISTDNAFKDFILPDKCERDLRKTIYKSTSPKISDLQGLLPLLNHQRWNYIFIKPERKKGMFHVINYNDNIRLKGLAFVHTFEYAIIFIINKRAIPEKFKYYINNKFNLLKFLNIKTDLWNSWIMNITEQMKENFKNVH